MERDSDSRRRIATAIATLAVLATTAVLATAPAAGQDAEVAVTQSVSSDTVAPGDAIDVRVGVNGSGLSAPGLDADLDPRWSVAVTDSDGARYRDGRHQWIWSSGGDYTVRYTATVPDDAAPGRYLVVAKGSAIDRARGVRHVTVHTTPLTVAAGPVNDTEPDDGEQGAATDPEIDVVFDHSPDSPNVTDTVDFDASGSSATNGSITSYRWWFGDTETATGPTPSHAYDEAGTYLVTLEVGTDDGSSRVLQRTVTVASESPVQGPIGQPTPVIDVTPGTAVDPGTNLTFNGSASSDEEGDITAYEWDVDGDGSFDDEGPVTTHRYDRAGNYTVRLRVTDTSGATATATQRIEVRSTDETGAPSGPTLIVAVALAGLLAAAAYVYTSRS